MIYIIKDKLFKIYKSFRQNWNFRLEISKKIPNLSTMYFNEF